MFTLRLLGGLSLTSERNHPVGRAAQKRRLALLSVLVSRPGLPVTRDKLLALFWPEASSDEARHRLSAALYDLRRALGDDVVVVRGNEVSIAPDSIDCDVVSFERAIAAGDWQHALELYRGPFLDGVHIDEAAEFDEWVEQRRMRLAHARNRALEEWAEECVRRGAWSGAVDAWQRLAEADPLSDRNALGLMKALESAGNRAGALRHATVHERRLRSDLGVEPDQALVSYVAALRAARGATPNALDATPDPESGPGTTPMEPHPSTDPGARDPVRRTWPRRTAPVAAAAVLLLTLVAVRVIPDASANVAEPAKVAAREGEAHLLSGRFEAAVASFDRAITLDTSYALGYFQFAVATLWADQPGEKITVRTQAAFERRDRLSDFDRTLLDGFIAWRRGEWHQAEGAYRRALIMNPKSFAARHELGEVLFHYNAPQGRSNDEARAEFERVLEVQPRHYGALWHLAQLSARDGRLADVDAFTRRILDLEPDAVRTLEVTAFRAVALKDRRAVDSLLVRLRDADESLLFGIGWRMAVFNRDLDGAERTFRLLTGPNRAPFVRGLGETMLLYLDIARGRSESIVNRLQRLQQQRDASPQADFVTLLAFAAPGSSLPVSIVVALRDSLEAQFADRNRHASLTANSRLDALTSLGLACALLGDSAGAFRAADQLESWKTAGPGNESAVRGGFAALIRAVVARQAGRFQDVIKFTDRSFSYGWFADALVVPLSAYALNRYVRAEALLEVGRLEEADAWFSTIGNHDPSDLVFLNAALDARLRIASIRGDQATAQRLRVRRDELRDIGKVSASRAP